MNEGVALEQAQSASRSKTNKQKYQKTPKNPD